MHRVNMFSNIFALSRVFPGFKEPVMHGREFHDNPVWETAEFITEEIDSLVNGFHNLNWALYGIGFQRLRVECMHITEAQRQDWMQLLDAAEELYKSDRNSIELDLAEERGRLLQISHF